MDPAFLHLIRVWAGYTRDTVKRFRYRTITFERVTRSAQELGMSRSEFFTRAAVAYLGELESKSLSAQINAALELIGDDESYQDVV